MPNPRAPKPRPPDDPAQSDRFISTAKQLEAEEGGALFERAMKAAVPPATVRAKPSAKRKPKP